MPTRPTLTSRALLACAAATAVLLLPGCGGSDDPAETLRKAFDTEIESANTNVTARVAPRGSAPQAQTPYSLRLTGPFVNGEENQTSSLDLQVTAAQGPGTFTGRVVTVPDNAFLVVQNQAYEVGREQFRQALQSTPVLGALLGARDSAVDPATWIVDPQVRGEADVAGEETTHIAGRVDVARMLRDLNRVQQTGGGGQGIPEPQIAEVTQAVQQPGIDVFVAGDDTVRRLALNVAVTVPPEQRQSGVEGGTINMTTEFSDVGGDQEVTPPPNAQPIQQLLQQLAPLLGGVPQGGGGGGAQRGR